MTYGPIREALAAAGEDLKKRFEAGESVVELVKARAKLIDDLLIQLWNDHVADCGAALVAVGGYGRGELHPGSDVDVMILLPESISTRCEESLSGFVTCLWDVGLEVGHSVRTIAQCADEASADLTIVTSFSKKSAKNRLAAIIVTTTPPTTWNPI